MKLLAGIKTAFYYKFSSLYRDFSIHLDTLNRKHFNITKLPTDVESSNESFIAVSTYLMEELEGEKEEGQIEKNKERLKAGRLVSFG